VDRNKNPKMFRKWHFFLIDIAQQAAYHYVRSQNLFLGFVTTSPKTRFSMNSPNEPAPRSGRRAEGPHRPEVKGSTGRILRMASNGREGLVRMEEELIGG
jgi:hypothetical protein